MDPDSIWGLVAQRVPDRGKKGVSRSRFAQVQRREKRTTICHDILPEENVQIVLFPKRSFLHGPIA